jgi:pSer/pThr/pTyr-binding forkhead associated (FHA) protein
MIIRTLILRPTDDSFRTERTVTLSTVDPSLSNNTPDPKTSNILIGRGKTLSDCLATTLLFHTRVVSRHHGLLLLRPDAKIYLQDTGSSSGTFLNGSRLSPAGVKSRPFELVDGDRIQLGEDIVLDGRKFLFRESAITTEAYF